MLKKTLYVITLISLVLLMYQVYDYVQFTKGQNDDVYRQGQETTQSLKSQVNDLLLEIVQEGDRLANLFGSKDLTSEEIEGIIKNSALKIPETQGVTACYEPYAHMPTQRLYCPYYDKGTSEYLRIGESYDYTAKGAKGTDWYTRIRDDGARWVEPYYANAANDWYIDYGVPFYYKEGENKDQVKGTITMSFVASGFKKIIHDLSIGKTGYGIITSQDGVYLSHPINEYVGTRNIQEDIDIEKSPERRKAFEQMEKGEKGHKSFVDIDTKEKSIFFYDKIPVSGWEMGIVFYENDLIGDKSVRNRKYIVMSILLSLFFLFLIAIYFNKDYLDRSEIWQLSVLASILLITNIFLVGYLQHNTVRQKVKSVRR